MSDFFNDINKILKKDLVPIFVKYFKDPNNNITDNLNIFNNDTKALLTDLFEKFSRNNDIDNNQRNYTDIENTNDINKSFDIEYDELFKRLSLIEENMIEIQKILKDNN